MEKLYKKRDELVNFNKVPSMYLKRSLGITIFFFEYASNSAMFPDHTFLQFEAL